MAVTIGVVASVYGQPYYKFVLPWSGRVASLNRLPDQVTIAHDGIPVKYRDAVAEILPVEWVESHVPFTVHPQVNVNTAIAETFTNWVVKVDIDDLLFPHAFDGVEDSPADVMNFGYRVGGTDCPSRVVSAEEVLEKRSNLIGSCSPFRKWLWELNPFEDRCYDDWCFWIKAARNRAVFSATRRTDYEYRTHPDQITHRLNHNTAHKEIADL